MKLNNKENAGLNSIDSSSLSNLRDLINNIKLLKDFIGDIAQFNLVIDTNYIIGDLIWLTKKRKYPTAKTDVQECVLAGTFIVFCTKTVIDEVNEKLAGVANQHGVSLNFLRKEWESYQSMLKVKQPDNEITEKYNNGVDPDDAPTLALAEQLLTEGILSKDRHINMMGGKAISFDFCTSARDYSRKATISVTLRIGGMYSVVIGVELFKGLYSLIKSITAWIKDLPKWVKILLIVGILIAFFLAKFREYIFNIMNKLISTIKESFPSIFEVLNQIIIILKENEPVAPIIN